MMKRVVVTGMGAITPIGNTLNEYWKNLKKGFQEPQKLRNLMPLNLKPDLLVK